MDEAVEKLYREYRCAKPSDKKGLQTAIEVLPGENYITQRSSLEQVVYTALVDYEGILTTRDYADAIAADIFYYLRGS